MDFAHISEAFVRRLNQPGPRYTSYPTAPEWRDGMGEEFLLQRLAQRRSQEEGGRTPTPLSLYVHIPFCREICHFCGCNTFQSSDKKYSRNYVDHLLRELDLLGKNLETKKAAVQLHWGGGTPTFLEEEQIRRLKTKIDSTVNFSSDAEIAIELDPRVTTFSQLALLKELGFNRISLGVQDFDPEVQKAANRIQPQQMTAAFYQEARRLGFNSINFDLVYGLPKQTLGGFARTVREVIAMRPDRIALFSYAHVPWLKPYQRKIDATLLPEGYEKFQAFLQSRQLFIDAGYVTIGMDHFALPNDELSLARQQGRLRRNFQGYTVKPESHVLAVGITGISDLGDIYLQNDKKFNTYYASIDAGHLAVHRGCLLTADDQIRRSVITELMCNFRLDFRSIEQRYGIDFHQYFKNELVAVQALEAEAHSIDDSFLTLSSDAITIAPLGQLFIRNISMIFDAYLKNRSHGEQRFSKTV